MLADTVSLIVDVAGVDVVLGAGMDSLIPVQATLLLGVLVMTMTLEDCEILRHSMN